MARISARGAVPSNKFLKIYTIGVYRTRELLLRGNLNNGGIAGPAYVNANNGLSNTWWNILGTISAKQKNKKNVSYKPAEEAFAWETKIRDERPPLQRGSDGSAVRRG